MSVTTRTQNRDPLRARLEEAQAAARRERNAHAACQRQLAAAKAAVGALTCPPAEMRRTPEWKAAEQAKTEADEVYERLQATEEVERGVLQLIGEERPGGVRRDQNGPRPGVLGGGWLALAAGIDLEAGRTRADVPLSTLVRGEPMAAGVGLTPSEGLTVPALQPTVVAEKAMDVRFLAPLLPRVQLEAGVNAIDDWVQTGSRTVEGTVERDPFATSEKAKVSVDVASVTPSLKQFAALIEKMQKRLLETMPQAGAFLAAELQFVLEKALDTHVLAMITAAEPEKLLEGESLLVQLRNAVKAHRALGANPTIVALNPTDAASLDLDERGADKLLTFPPRSSGTSSPIWGLRVVEVSALGEGAPVLIDPAVLGVLYEGTARLLADPYSGADTNEVRVRLEFEALMHVRDVAGAFVVEAAE
jgi:hypothetical protein